MRKPLDEGELHEPNKFAICDIESKVLRTVFIPIMTVWDKSKFLIQAKFSFCLILLIETRFHYLFEPWNFVQFIALGSRYVPVILTHLEKES